MARRVWICNICDAPYDTFEEAEICETRHRHKGRVIAMLERLRRILINEFSYDGADPKGVKAYQEEVDAAQSLIDRLKQETH